MVPIRLDTGDFGDAIARLHESLRKQGFQVSPEEEKRKFFGPSTSEAVRAYQREHKLPATGVVDTATHAVLETATSVSVTELPAIRLSQKATAVSQSDGGNSPTRESTAGVGQVAPMPAGRFVVRGRVVQADGKPLTGARVHAYDKDLRHEQPLGQAILEPDGYEIYYTAAQFRRAEKGSAELFIVVFDADEHEIARSDVVFNARQEETIDLTVPGGEPELCEIDQIRREIQLLLEGQGDSGENLPMDQLNASDITFLANDTGIVRERIAWFVQAVKLALGTAKPDADLTSFKSFRAPVPQGLVPHIPPEAFYGWFRLDLSQSLETLWATPTDTLIRTLESAIGRRIIPLALNAELDPIRARIEQIKLDIVLKTPISTISTSLDKLLDTLPKPPNLNQRLSLASVAADLRPDDPKLVERIASIPGFNGDAVGVARTLRLGALTQGHMPLVQALQARLGKDNDGTLRPLAELRPDEWLNMVYNYGTPDTLSITPDAFADALSATIEQAHPTATLAAHINGGRRLAKHPLLSEASTFLKNNPDFDIVTANLNMLREDTQLEGITDPEKLVTGLRALQRMKMVGASWDETSVLLVNDLYSPHHVLVAGPAQLTLMLGGSFAPDRIMDLYQQAEELHNGTFAAVTAAFSVFSGPRVFAGIQFGQTPEGDPVPGEVPGGPTDPYSIPLQELIKKAKGPQIEDTTIIKYVRQDLSIVPRVPTPPEKVGPEKPSVNWGSVLNRQPTLQYLFGDQDSCRCEHCNSVLSPAAYFVDVLQFIKDAKLQWNLLGRRPDLLDLELSCENTNTEVPSIDLVLEILENAVALPLDVDLPAGTDIEAQLTGTVGGAVQDALLKTVRQRSVKVHAKLEAGDWTVVDGHRRWKLTAQKESALQAKTITGDTRPFPAEGLNLQGIIEALDLGKVAPDAEAAFAQLFVPNNTNPPDFSNYDVTITPLLAGRSWRVEYRAFIKLFIQPDTNELVLKTRTDVPWWQRKCYPKTIQYLIGEPESGNAPVLVQKLCADHLPSTGKYEIKAGEINQWFISSGWQQLTLNYTPARLCITSLAYQSGDANADALAWPENQNPEAYIRLRGDAARAIPVPTFPWSLPIDLPLDEIRLFLERARSSRRELIESLLPLDPAGDDVAIWIREVLGLSEAEASLIAPPPTHQPTDADIFGNWGLSSTAAGIWDAEAGKDVRGAPLDLLKTVSIMLQQSRLEFEELEAVLMTRFVQGSTGPLGIEPSTTCKPGEMKLPDLKPAHLDRIHRFVRLQRRLGWSTQDLDSAICLMTDNAPLDGDALLRLAQIVRLHELLKQPITKIIMWWDSSVTDSDRKRLLARSVRLSIGELDHAIQLIGGVDPLASPGDMLTLSEGIIELRRSGISFEDLRYLLQHVQPDETAGANITSNLPLREAQMKRLANAARNAANSIPDGSDSAPVSPIHLAREDAVIAALATGLGKPSELVDHLLRTRLRHPSDANNPAIDAFLESSFLGGDGNQLPSDKLVSVLLRLYKAAYICDTLKLNNTDLQWVSTSTTSPYGFIALDFDALPVAPDATPANIADFKKLLALIQMRRLASGAGDMLHKYAEINMADLFTNAATVGKAQQVLADGLELDKEEVVQAANRLKITPDQYRDPSQLGERPLYPRGPQLKITPDRYRDPSAVKRLVELLAAMKQLGTTVAQALKLTASTPEEVDATAACDLLHNKYGDSNWHDLIKPIADKLRERQRDALVDYLITRDSQIDAGGNCQIKPGFRLRDANDLYEYYLIDVQIGSCMKTTRLLMATAAAQLFVQRVLLNLESGTSLDDVKRELWDWMHSYRVWEANRKVFLFPENWLLPELRDDKTEIFRAMEGVLGQNELSLETAREALLGYLDDFADQAQISIVALHQEETTLYAVGRTPNQPYRYFWRACTNFGADYMSWSGWEALDLENANDFIMPFVLEGDLHVAWPIFTKMSGEKKVDENDPGRQIPLWKVQLAWARRTTHGWSKRKIGTVQLDQIVRLPNIDELRSFKFQLSKEVDSIKILENLSLDRETINIDCFSAREPASNIPFDVVPDLNKLEHQGDYIPFDQWNVKCKVSGVAYRWTLVDAQNNQKIYEPANPLSIHVEWYFKDRQDHTTWYHYTDTNTNTQPIQTDKNGIFQFAFPETNGVVLNGSDVTLTFMWPSGEESVQRTLKSGDHYYSEWTWEYNAGHEDKHIADKYHSDRDLSYQWEKRFVIEPGQDLGLGWGNLPSISEVYWQDYNGYVHRGQVNGNRYVLPEAIFPDKVLAVVFQDAYNWMIPIPPRPLELELPLVATLATRFTRSPAAVSPRESPVYYILNKQGGWYLRIRGAIPTHWPDGQPYASSYRTAAVSSLVRLFQPELQAYLHTDGFANNFGRINAYANYNWELFLHVPLAIADHFAGQQRFADARRWLHFVFDPTTADKDTKTGVPNFWRFLEFIKENQPESIATLLTWLADPDMVDPKDAQEFKNLGTQIEEWKKNPFMPHLVARLRPSAYQWYTFLSYLDVLIGWGDQLFRRDTRESVNDATLLYVLAAKLLGPRPKVIPEAIQPPALTYRSLLGKNSKGLDDFGNAWVTYTDLPGVRQLIGANNGRSQSSGIYPMMIHGQQISQYQSSHRSHGTQTQTLTSLSTLAFCIPQNDKVTGYYDLIEQRLNYVRNCQNIDGVFRELPLYDPPIDPLLLIRARAAGLDLQTVIAERDAPLPNYRFSFTLQKALELAAELKALGSALLAALEKGDAEELALLRSSQEISMLNLVREIRQKQVDEAGANLLALQQSEETLLERFGQYQKLLGKPGITRGQDGLPVVEQTSSLSVSIDPVGAASGLGLSSLEIQQLLHTALSNELHQQANIVHVVASIVSMFPNIFAGSPVAGQTSGGTNWGIGISAMAQSIEIAATEETYLANLAGTFGGYQRRQDEWVHQSKLALAELKQLKKQIVAAEIRQAIAQHELDNHDRQIENAQAVDEFMHSKFTNQQLHRWMSTQIAEVYFRTYQLAYDVAKRAERCYRFELGLEDSNFIQFGYWESLKKGLLAGERLYHDLKRMEVAYLEQNKREYELIKHISLVLLNPMALIALKETGKCEIHLPEALFDMDYPGHYMRRIKSVSLSIPCVTGPYTSINCTLTLLSNQIRKNTKLTNDPQDPYSGPKDDDDLQARFITTFGAVESIATSTAQNDSGMFEVNFRDERYLRFEGSGVISKWRIEMPKDCNAFDFETISDVILKLNYTAREGGISLRDAARKATQMPLPPSQPLNVEELPEFPPAEHLQRLFSSRHEFASEWYRFLHPTDEATSQTLSLGLTMERFPFELRGKTLQIDAMHLFLKLKEGLTDKDNKPFTYNDDHSLAFVLKNDDGAKSLASDFKVAGSLIADLPNAEPLKGKSGKLGEWSLEVKEEDVKKIDSALCKKVKSNGQDHTRLNPDAIEDVLIVCQYQVVQKQ